MGLDLATAAVVFGAVFLVELPDRTFLATMVMSTRLRPLFVWLGVTGAFLVHSLVAVTFGSLISQLPRKPAELFAAVMFLVGGILLLRGAGAADAAAAESNTEAAVNRRRAPRGWRDIGFAFTVILVAELGALTNLLTVSFVLTYEDPVSVFTGAFLALSAVSGLGALLGQALLVRVRLATIRRVGGVLCLILSALAVMELTGVR